MDAIYRDFVGLFLRVWKRGPGNHISEVIGGYIQKEGLVWS